jgi:hypothetical protein
MMGFTLLSINCTRSRQGEFGVQFVFPSLTLHNILYLCLVFFVTKIVLTSPLLLMVIEFVSQWNFGIFQPWAFQQHRVNNIQYHILNDSKGDYVRDPMDMNFKILD